MHQDNIYLLSKAISEPIEHLRLKENILNILKLNNIHTVEELVRQDPKSILKLPKMGKNKLQEITEKLKIVNLDFNILDNISKELLEAHCMAHRISKALDNRKITYNTDILSKKIAGLLSRRTVNCLNSSNINYVYEIFVQDEKYYKKIRGLGNLGIRELINLGHELNINFGVKYSANILDKIKQKIQLEKESKVRNSKKSESIKGVKFIKKENINEEIFKADLFFSREYYEKFSNYLKNNLTEKFYIELRDNTFLEVPISSILKTNTHLSIFFNRLIEFDNKKTLEELGENCGLTRERIRQIEKKIVHQLSTLGIDSNNLVDLKIDAKQDKKLKFNERNFLNFDVTKMKNDQINDLKDFRVKIMTSYFNHILDENNAISKQHKEMCEEFFSLYDGYENFFTMRADKSPTGNIGKLYFILYKIYLKKYNERPTANISYYQDMSGEKRGRSHRSFLAHAISHMQSRWRAGNLNQEAINELKNLGITERFEKTYWTEERIKNLLKKVAIEELKDPYICPSVKDMQNYGIKYDPKFKLHSFISAAQKHQTKTEVLSWPMVAKKYEFDAVKVWVGFGHLGEYKLMNTEEAIKIEEK